MPRSSWPRQNRIHGFPRCFLICCVVVCFLTFHFMGFSLVSVLIFERETEKERDRERETEAERKHKVRECGGREDLAGIWVGERI